MKYRLVSLGKLKPGVNEKDALPALMKLTKLPELTVRKKLLAGKRTSLMTSADVNKIASAKGRFSAVGLLLEVVEVADAPSPPVTQPKKASSGNFARHLKRLVWSFVAVLVLVLGATGGLWYWLFMMPDPNASQIESALVHDQTLAVANIDFSQLNKLEQLTRTQVTDFFNPDADANLLVDVLSMAATDQLTLNQAYIVALASNGGNRVDGLAVVTGHFSPEQWRAQISRYFDMGSPEQGITPMQRKKQVSADQCPSEVVAGAQPVYAKLMKDQVVFATSVAAINQFESRLTSVPGAGTQLAQWQQLKKYKFLSAMVFSPTDSSNALPGIAGMIGGQVAKSIPSVSSLSLSAQVDVMARGVRMDATLNSTDSAWNAQASNMANSWIETTRNNSRVTSDVLSSLLNQLSIRADDTKVTASWSVNRHSLSDLKHSLENSLASLFGGSMVSVGAGETEINDKPMNYNRPISLAQLPSFDVPEYGGKPLFINGPFAVDVQGIRMLDSDFLEMAVDAKAALPTLDDTSGLGELFRYSLTIDDVLDRQGGSLLRDELCVTNPAFFGVKNHEPETQGTAFFEQASVTKRVRLTADTNVSDISQVRGRYQLGYPLSVQKLPVDLKAGEMASFAGTQVEIVALGRSSVRYKVTGKSDQLLEVRGLNAQGQVLREGWKSTFGALSDQSYQGEVSAIELYIANGFEQRSVEFVLDNIFVREGEGDDSVHPFALSYTPVQRAKWNQYQFVDMRLVKATPDQWSMDDPTQRAVANKAWPGVKLFITHNPDGWNNNPQAHVNLPLWIELYASMSSLSYQLSSKDAVEQFVPVRFPYRQDEEGIRLLPSQTVRQQPFGVVNFDFDAGYEAGQPFKDFAGKLTLRMPLTLTNQDYAFNDLWKTKQVNGVDVTLDNVSRGTFAGYHFELRGDLSNLIAVHGINEYGERIAPSTMNYQNDGYWLVTIPFRDELNSLRIVTATEQDVFELPFRF